MKGSNVLGTHASGFRLAASLGSSEPCPLEAAIPSSKVIAGAMARTCRDEGTRSENRTDYDRALVLYQRMLDLNKAARGEDHPDTAISYERLGKVSQQKGNYDRALELQEKSLAVRRRVLGPEHVQ